MAYTRKKAQFAELEDLMHWLFTQFSNDSPSISNIPTLKNRNPARTSGTSYTRLSTISNHTPSADYEFKHIHLQEVALPLAILSLELALLELRTDLGIADTWHGGMDKCEDCVSGAVTGTHWWLELRKSKYDAEIAQRLCGDGGQES